MYVLPSLSPVWLLLFNILSIVVACEVMHFIYNGYLMEFPFLQKQLQDYVTWVNTYLKRRPGVKLICDLRSFSDGITLVHLAEIVGE